jgi:hypothetical protein
MYSRTLDYATRLPGWTNIEIEAGGLMAYGTYRATVASNWVKIRVFYIPVGIQSNESKSQKPKTDDDATYELANGWMRWIR